MPTGREQWFAGVLQAGLETTIVAEPDILSHATPAVLTGALPRDVMVRVFEAALTTGTMSPKVVVETATPEVLAKHLPAILLWGCIGAAAERAGITASAGTTKPEAIEFLRRALDRGLQTGTIQPKDVVQHVDAKVLGHHLPEALTTKLLEVSLAAGKLTPDIIVEALGAEAIAKHAPSYVVWACLNQAAENPAAGAGEAPLHPKPSTIPPKPALEFLDDDVASVLVDLDDSGVLSVESIAAAEKDHKDKEKEKEKAAVPAPPPKKDKDKGLLGAKR